MDHMCCLPYTLCIFRLRRRMYLSPIFFQPTYVGFGINQYFTNVLQPTQHTVNSLCNKLSSSGSKNVISDANHLNSSFISVFSGFIFIWHSCEHREWACPAMQSIKKKKTKSSRHYLGSRNFSDWFHIG